MPSIWRFEWWRMEIFRGRLPRVGERIQYNLYCLRPYFLQSKTYNLGEDKISVPDAFFKVILRLGKNPQALGFIYPNKDCSGGKARYVKSVDEVEKVTGMDFFPSLDDKVENEVERKSNLQL